MGKKIEPILSTINIYLSLGYPQTHTHPKPKSIFAVLQGFTLSTPSLFNIKCLRQYQITFFVNKISSLTSMESLLK